MSAVSPSPPRPPERPTVAPREQGAHATRGAPGGSSAAFIFGLPLAAALLALLHFGPLRHTPAHRYVTHPIENVEIVVFCSALGVLAAKVWGSRAQRRALAARILPPWDGQPLPPSEAPALLAELS